MSSYSIERKIQLLAVFIYSFYIGNTNNKANVKMILKQSGVDMCPYHTSVNSISFFNAMINYC